MPIGCVRVVGYQDGIGAESLTKGADQGVQDAHATDGGQALGASAEPPGTPPARIAPRGDRCSGRFRSVASAAALLQHDFEANQESEEVLVGGSGWRSLAGPIRGAGNGVIPDDVVSNL